MKLNKDYYEELLNSIHNLGLEKNRNYSDELNTIALILEEFSREELIQLHEKLTKLKQLVTKSKANNPMGKRGKSNGSQT